MTSDREDRRVRRGHAWAREAQDFAPRHAQDPLPPRRSRLSSLSRSLSPPPSPPLALPLARTAGPSRPSALLARSRHVILRDWLVSCPRAALCLHAGTIYRVKWWMEGRNSGCFASTFLRPPLPSSSRRRLSLSLSLGTTRICL